MKHKDRHHHTTGTLPALPHWLGSLGQSLAHPSRHLLGAAADHHCQRLGCGTCGRGDKWNIIQEIYYTMVNGGHKQPVGDAD